MVRERQATFGVAVWLAVLLGAGPAAAEAITGTADGNVLRGTPRRDTIRGLRGDDDIAGGRAPDLVFGNRGGDRFRWSKGDGQDRVDGGPETDGPDFDWLSITAAGSLRLHIDALGAGPLATVGAGLEAVGVTRLEGIGIDGTAGADEFVVSSDAGVLGPEVLMGIATGAGRDRVDARNVRSRTSIDSGSSTRDTAGDVVRGSLEFYDFISTGPGDDKIWTGRGGSLVDSGMGRDEIHLGAGPDRISLGTGYSRGAKVVHGFGADDIVDLYDIHSDWPRVLDTSGDGRLDARDRTVRVRDGSMTIDLTAALDGEPASLTLVGRTRVGMDRFVRSCDC